MRDPLPHIHNEPYVRAARRGAYHELSVGHAGTFSPVRTWRTGETMIVTATRTEIPLSDATVPVTVITREEIEMSLARDLAELLRFQAGIDIGRNGGPGQATSVFMRGTESNHTLVLWMACA